MIELHMVFGFQSSKSHEEGMIKMHPLLHTVLDFSIDELQTCSHLFAGAIGRTVTETEGGGGGPGGGGGGIGAGALGAEKGGGDICATV